MLASPAGPRALSASSRLLTITTSLHRLLYTSSNLSRHGRSSDALQITSKRARPVAPQQPASKRTLSGHGGHKSSSRPRKQRFRKSSWGKSETRNESQDSFPPADWATFDYTPPSFDRPIYFAYNNNWLQLSLDGRACHFNVACDGLRDKCNCSKCRDPSSSQKNFSTTELPAGLKLSNIVPDAEGIEITFKRDIPRLADDRGQHVMRYSWDDVKQYMIPMRDLREPVLGKYFQAGLVHWDKDIMTKRAQSVDYNDYVKGGDAMWQVVRELSRTGLAFLHNVPEDPDSIEHITTTIAPIQSTFYGRTFDVRAKPNAENVAYTSASLGLHQDLLYLLSPPRIQILHYMANSCSGGESLFSDTDRVGRMLNYLAHHSSIVRSLSKHAIAYGYNANGSYYQRLRKVLCQTDAGEYLGMWWSPPFQSPKGSPNVNRTVVRSHQLLEKLLNDPDAVYERKMKPGECVLFDNRRVAHGRKAFNAEDGGSRWLRGAYISDEDFKSRLHFMPEEDAETKEADSTVYFKTGMEIDIPGFAQAQSWVQEDSIASVELRQALQAEEILR